MADADNTYAVVDMSKKRKNHILPGNDTAESAAPDSMATDDSAMALYATVDKSKKRKNLSSKQETAKKTNSTPPLYDADSTPLEENYSMDSLHHSANQKKSLPETGAETATTMSPSKKAKTSKNISRSKKFTCIAAIIVVVVVVAVAFSALICIAVLFKEITTLKTKTASLVNIENKLLITTEKLELKLNASIDMNYQQLSNQLNTSLIQQLQLESSIANNTQQLNTIYQQLTSCAALPPAFPSGYYSIRASNGSAVRVYCDVTRTCGNVTGGWMRVAELDMTDSSHQCPSNLMERPNSSKRTCVITSTNEAVCSTTLFSSALEYSKVCGKIIGYQIGGTDSFFRNPPRNQTDQNYVDGVTLTHGNPRQHIWTFAAAFNEANNKYSCPCSSNLPNIGTPPPAFVRQDYFCDTAINGGREIINSMLYADDPLWDGASCGPLNTCCSLNTAPWFYKQLPQSTTEDIEMRVCRDEDVSNEDIAIESVEIYVQ